ncbi:uncharacterized protein CDAR_270301, partial [Caerostris darwini]
MSNKRVRYNVQDDLIILREIVAVNPYGDSARWTSIQESVCKTTNKIFSTRSVKDHAERLVKLYNVQDRTNLRKSGCEKQYSEKEQLLQNMKQLMKEQKKKQKCSFNLKDKVSIQKGIEKRNEELEFLMAQYKESENTPVDSERNVSQNVEENAEDSRNFTENAE